MAQCTGCRWPNAPEDAWAEFEEQAAEAAGLGWVLSAGDFNARTQSRNTGQGRVSEDTVRPSRQGLRLLQLIEAVGLTIANGATAGATSGHYTFQGHNGKSVVDYFLLCPPLMQAATRLDVEHLPPHDCVDHCVLRLTLSGIRQAPQPPPAHAPCAMLPPTQKYLYSAEHLMAHAHQIKDASAAAALADVAAAADAAPDVEALAGAYKAFEEILTTSILEAGGEAVAAGAAPAPRAVRRRRVDSHPRLKELVRRWRQARRHHNLEAMRRLTREIGGLRRALIKQQKVASQQNLLQMARDEPARFWRYFNKPDGAQGDHSPAALREYCAQLLTLVGAQPDANDAAQPAQLCADGEELNYPFSVEEVCAGIATLKRGKAVVGPLSVGMIRVVSEEVAPAIVAIFNAVARLQCMPAEMALGVITMVLKKGGGCLQP